MDGLPRGWVQRRSGIMVPGSARRERRLASLGRIVLLTLLAAAHIASGVSVLSRAPLDVNELVHTLLFRSQGNPTPLVGTRSKGSYPSPLLPDEREHEGRVGRKAGRGISWPEATAFPEAGFR